MGKKVNTYSFVVGALTITVVVLSVYFLFDYLYRKWMREGFNTTYGCDPNMKQTSESGCIPPTLCDGNCDEHMYIDTNNHKFKKCYYQCGDPLKQCKYDMCCKDVYPPVYFRLHDSAPAHPSQIIHVDHVIKPGVYDIHENTDSPSGSSSSSSSSSSSDMPTGIPNSSNSATNPTPRPEFEPLQPSSSSSSSSSQSNGGNPMPEFEPNSQQPATTPARFPDVSQEESTRRNQAYMEGNMTRANGSSRYQNDPAPADETIDNHAYVDCTGMQQTPQGYTDPLIL